MYYSVVDYLNGTVIYARCAESTNCATDVTKWTPSTVFEAATVNGQADLVNVSGNSLVFVGRDTTRAYMLEPYTMAPLGRALVPDFETGGVRVSLTPRDFSAADGYRALYNTTGFSDALLNSVSQLDPALENFTVSSTAGATIYGAPTAYKGEDVSVSEPLFKAHGVAPGGVTSTNTISLPVYANNGTCHFVGYVDGTGASTKVQVSACAIAGDCTSLGTALTLMSLPTSGTLSGLALTATGSSVFAAITGTVSTNNENMRVGRASLSGACALSGAATAVDVFASTLTEPPSQPAIAATSSTLYVVYGGDAQPPLQLSTFAYCDLSTACDEPTDFHAYNDFNDTDNAGNALLATSSRLFWAAYTMHMTPARWVVRVVSCDHTGSNPCQASTDWSPPFPAPNAAATLQTTLSNASSPLPMSLSQQGGHLLLTAEDDFFWCNYQTPATSCQNANEWLHGEVSAEQLALMPVTSGIVGLNTSGGLLYSAFINGGISLQQCDKRCWDADNWAGGFVARGATYGAKPPPGGSFGSFDSNGALTLIYPVLGAGDMPDKPKKLLFIDGATFDVQR